MDKVFVGISWKGNPAFGLNAMWNDGVLAEVRVMLFGLDLFGIQFKRG
jgi:hypothetical protein